MASELASAYRSASQRARVVTEAWGATNLYCPNCPSPQLTRLQHNTKASDYCCPKCGFWYQLKGQQSPILTQIDNGAFSAMIEAIRNDRTPNFYFMQYELVTWSVKNLLLIPSFAFPESAIVRKTKSAFPDSAARRLGRLQYCAEQDSARRANSRRDRTPSCLCRSRTSAISKD